MKTTLEKPDLLAFARLRSIFDQVLILACFMLVHRMYFDDLDLTTERLLVMVFAMATAYVVLTVGGLYRSEAGARLTDEVARLIICWSLTVLAIGLFAFLTKVAIEVSRFWFGTSMVLSFCALLTYRAALRYSLFWMRSQGLNFTSVVIVGGGDLANQTMQRVMNNHSAGYRIDGVFDDSLERGHEPIPGCRVVGGADDILPFIERMRRDGQPVEQVWSALPLSEIDRIESLSEQLKDTSVDICVVPGSFALKILTGSTQRVGDMSVVNVSDVNLPVFGEWYKTFFDYAVASVAIAVLWPFMLIIALLIRLESRGPALFRQHRYGIDGQEIEVWKFRTMRVQEDGDTVVQAKRNDSRITRLGAFLRRTSLDELPQFLNVLQGSMSVVGPRPHAVTHNEEYRGQIEGYMMRHKIKPGITGLAQVNGWRGETDTLEKMEKRIQFDLEYIRNWSPLLDVKILLLTVLKGFTGKNAY